MGHKKDPHQTLESLERWSGRATLIILLGIVVEIGLLFCFPHDPFEKLGSVIADGMVGIGLAIEYVAILRTIVAAREANRQSDEKVAEANARAAAAQLETEQLKVQFAWRGLATHQNKLIDVLERNPGIVVIEYASADPDSSLLAKQFGSVFGCSKWTAILQGCLYTATDLAFGIIVSDSDAEPDSASHNSSIAKALKAAGIEFRVDTIPEWYAGTADESYVSGRGPRARVFIGPKEPIFEPIRKTAAAK